MDDQSVYRDLRRTEAENYARDFVPLIPAPLAADLIEAAAPAPGEFVVDIACGTGVLTRLAAERVTASGKVVGVDLVPEMLDVAAATPRASGAAIDWQQGDAGALPLADESCDLVLCQLGLMFFPDRSAAVQEMWRVLSPGGRVAVNAPSPMPRWFDVLATAVGHHLGPDAAGFLRAVFSLGDTELRSLLVAGQFHDVTVTTATKTLSLGPPVEFLWQYLQVTPIAGAVRAADDSSRRALEDTVVAGWQDHVDDGGLTLELPIVTATARK